MRFGKWERKGYEKGLGKRTQSNPKRSHYKLTILNKRQRVFKDQMCTRRICCFGVFVFFFFSGGGYTVIKNGCQRFSFFVISKQINFGIWKGAWEAHSKQPKAKSLQIGKFKQATARFQRPNVHKDFHWRFCVFSFFLVVVTPWSKMVVKDGFVISQQINFGIFWR